MKQSKPEQPCLYHCLRSILGLLLVSFSFTITGCSGDEVSPISNTSVPATLSNDILSVRLSAAETDRFLAVTATIGNQYYAAGFTTVADDSQMAVARFGVTGGLDTSFGSNGIATVNVAVGTGKTAELVRSIMAQSD